MFELLKVPDYVSLSNVFFGIISIFIAACSDGSAPLLSIAAACLLLAAVADGMDGWVARKTSGGGPLGEHIDSLADAISFGVAPAVLLTVFCEIHGSFITMIIAAAVACIYLLCGVLRLARYNAFHSTIPSGYEGIPITAGCVVMAVFTIFLDKLDTLMPYSPEILIAVMFAMGLLMISKIPYSKVMKTNTFIFLIVVFALTVISSAFISIYAAIAPGILSLLMVLYLIIPIFGKLSGKKTTEI